MVVSSWITSKLANEELVERPATCALPDDQSLGNRLLGLHWSHVFFVSMHIYFFIVFLVLNLVETDRDLSDFKNVHNIQTELYEISRRETLDLEFEGKPLMLQYLLYHYCDLWPQLCGNRQRDLSNDTILYTDIELMNANITHPPILYARGSSATGSSQIISKIYIILNSKWILLPDR